MRRLLRLRSTSPHLRAASSPGLEDGERTRGLVPALALPASAIRRNALQIKPTGSDQGTTYRGIVGSAVDGASDGRVNLASERQATRGAAIDWVDVEGTAVIEDHFECALKGLLVEESCAGLEASVATTPHLRESYGHIVASPLVEAADPEREHTSVVERHRALPSRGLCSADGESQQGECQRKQPTHEGILVLTVGPRQLQAGDGWRCSRRGSPNPPFGAPRRV